MRLAIETALTREAFPATHSDGRTGWAFVVTDVSKKIPRDLLLADADGKWAITN